MLNDKQRAFCREYIKDCNASAAARRAGYSEKTAGQQGEQLLKKPQIKAALAKLRAPIESAAIMEYAEACEILSSMARANLGDYIGDGDTLDMDRVRQTNPAAVQSVDIAELPQGGRLAKLRLHDRIRAIERLAKLRGWDQPDKLDVNSAVTQFVMPRGLDVEGTEFDGRD